MFGGAVCNSIGPEYLELSGYPVSDLQGLANVQKNGLDTGVEDAEFQSRGVFGLGPDDVEGVVRLSGLVDSSIHVFLSATITIDCTDKVREANDPRSGHHPELAELYCQYQP